VASQRSSGGFFSPTPRSNPRGLPSVQCTFAVGIAFREKRRSYIPTSGLPQTKFSKTNDLRMDFNLHSDRFPDNWAGEFSFGWCTFLHAYYFQDKLFRVCHSLGLGGRLVTWFCPVGLCVALHEHSQRWALRA
jgi:hypothetical protein